MARESPGVGRSRTVALSARLALVACLLAVAFAPPAGAAAAQEDVSAQQVQQLARRAPNDPAALERLRQVRKVDGRPVDLRLALDAPPDTRAQRLRVLAEGGEAVPGSGLPPGGSDQAAREAGDILDDRRFQPRQPPRPFKGALRRLGGWLRPVAEPVGRFFERFLGPLFDLDDWWAVAFWVMAGLLVVGLAAYLSIRAARRRAQAGVLPGGRSGRPQKTEPKALEQQAEEAERRGELDRAFRLRFLAGLLRLDDAGHLSFRSSLTTGEVVRTVPSPTLSGLAGTLEGIVYAGHAARPDDLEAARSGWPRVLQEAGSGAGPR